MKFIYCDKCLAVGFFLKQVMVANSQAKEENTFHWTTNYLTNNFTNNSFTQHLKYCNRVKL